MSIAINQSYNFNYQSFVFCKRKKNIISNFFILHTTCIYPSFNMFECINLKLQTFNIRFLTWKDVHSLLEILTIWIHQVPWILWVPLILSNIKLSLFIFHWKRSNKNIRFVVLFSRIYFLDELSERKLWWINYCSRNK